MKASWTALVGCAFVAGLPCLWAFMSVSPRRPGRVFPTTASLPTPAPSRAAPLNMISREDLMQSLPAPSVVEAVEQKRGSPVLAADVASAAGISLSQARKDLTTLASLSKGDIAVSKDGDLIYKFPPNLSGALAESSAKYKALQTFRKYWPALYWVIRVSFGVTLLVSLAAIFSTIFFITSSSSSDDDRRDDRRGGGGMSFNYFWGPSPFDFFYYRPYGYYSYYGQPQQRDPEEMGFFESVFSYIFGDGDPNPNLDERRLSLAANMIRQNKGAVTAEQLAPFCDDAPAPSKAAESGYVDEAYVLPIVTALGGEPTVTEDGEIVYLFSDLQLSASGSKSLPSAVSSEAMVLKRAGLSSRASAGEIKRLLQYNRIPTRGALERSELIDILEDALPAPTEDEQNEMALSDTSLLLEREWKFSLASDLNKVLAGGLGLVNLGGALYLGNLLNQYAAFGVRLPSYFGTVQTLYPLLLGYAVLFNVIPLARNAWIKRQNEKIRQRNKVRTSWKAALASSIRNSSLQKKIASAQRMGTKVKQIGVSSKDIVYDTSSSMEDNQKKKARSDLDEFDKLLGEGGASSTTSKEISSSSSSQVSQGLQVVDGVRDLVDKFDVFLLDMWGVLHNGSAPYEGVLEALTQLHRRQKRLIILSNSSKRVDHSVKMLTKLGFNVEDHFEQIITSGEVAFHMLGGPSALPAGTALSWPLLDGVENKKAVCLGSGDQDASYLQACGWTLAPPEEASLVVARGTFTVDDGRGAAVDKRVDGPAAYDNALEKVLNACAARQLPMLVTNPDKVRPDEGFPPMPGHLGDLYHAALQKVSGTAKANDLIRRIGKPFADVYKLALTNVEDTSRVCMVGDALETDVTGGTKQGLATAWVLLDGIHNDGSFKNVDAAPRVCQEFMAHAKGTYAEGQNLKPDFVLPRFQW